MREGSRVILFPQPLFPAYMLKRLLFSHHVTFSQRSFDCMYEFTYALQEKGVSSLECSLISLINAFSFQNTLFCFLSEWVVLWVKLILRYFVLFDATGKSHSLTCFSDWFCCCYCYCWYKEMVLILYPATLLNLIKAHWCSKAWQPGELEDSPYLSRQSASKIRGTPVCFDFHSV